MNPEVAYAGLLETSAAVGQLILIAILLERALAFVFEYHWFAALSKRVEGLKAPIAFLLALLIVRQTRFDILGEMFRAEGEPVVVTWIGSVLTAAIIAGGSAGAMALFQTWFNWNRDARKNKQAARATEESAKLKEAQAREKFAEAELALAETKLSSHRQVAGNGGASSTGAVLLPADVGTKTPETTRQVVKSGTSSRAKR